MRLALASNYAPDRRPLSEYAFHLAGGLRSSAGEHEMVILSGRYPAVDAPDVLRILDQASPRLPLDIVAALRQHRVDALLFNTSFTNWGSNLTNLTGLLTPWFARRAGFRNVVTLLHHLPHTIDAARVGYRLTPLHRLAIELGCRAVAASTVVCFTLKRDLDCFQRRYTPRNIVHVPHGLLGEPRWRPPRGEGVVLAFGRWGRAKDPEPLLRAFARTSDATQRLIVAGPSAPSRPGFQERLADRYASRRITFTGYVPEDQIPDLFHSADLVVLPYKENAGLSGVLHQTCQYGRVPLMRRLEVFEEMIGDLGLTGYFYETEAELATQMRRLLADPARLAADGRHNFEAISALSMDRIAPIYWQLMNAHA
ncbi:MAG TPA: glycosyltransferase [Chloroflexota bacterium]